MRQRDLRPYLRLVYPPLEDDRRRIPPAEHTGTELDRALAPYVRAGWNITATGATAVVATAADYGLVWNAARVWDGIADIVAQMLHDEIIEHLARNGIDTEVAARHLAQRYGRNE